jgi:hypothetical protein
VLAIVLTIVLVGVTSGAAPRLGATSPASQGGAATQPADLAGALTKLTTVPASVLNKVGVAGFNASSSQAEDAVNPIESGSAPKLTSPGGKPVVFFLGAEFCPYCATERWSVILALSHFGTFSHLNATASSSTDVYPNTQSFTFAGSRYTSKYIDFAPVEVEDVSHDPLQSPTKAEVNVLAARNPQEVIPFLYIGNRYVGALPVWDTAQNLAGLTRSQIAADVWNPNSKVGREIVANANYLTAAICAADGEQPASVCNLPGVKAAAAELAHMPAAQAVS